MGLNRTKAVLCRCKRLRACFFDTLGKLSNAPQPLIRGSLRQTPLPELLVHLYDRQLDGTLLLQTAERKKSAVLFTRGAPSKARPAEKNVYLSEVAVDLGLIQRSVSVSTRKRAEASQMLHGEILVEGGHIDQWGLHVALREQLKRQVLLLCELPETTGFGFFSVNYLAEWGHKGSWRVKPLPLLWRALAEHLPSGRRDAWLAKLGDLPLRLRPEAPVSRYALTPKERGVVDMLRALPVTLTRLSQSGVGTEDEVRDVVCALFLSRQLDNGTDAEPVGLHEPPETPNSVIPAESRGLGRTVTLPRRPKIPAEVEGASSGSTSGDPATSGASPRSNLNDESEASRTAESRSAMSGRTITSRRPDDGIAASLREEIESYLEREPKTHYEVLGIQPDASTSAVRNAFFQLARRWHPDRLPPALSDLRGAVNQAFSKMGDAHQTLMDEQKRAEYDSALEGTSDEEQEQVATILRAASAYQRAEVLMKKKDLGRAFQEAKEAYELDPTQTEHVALYAWLRSTQDKDASLAQLISLLDNALKASPDHVGALWYRGQLLKKAKQHNKAMRDFKQILEIKPKHVDAAREVRVHAMRRRSDPNSGSGSTKTGGLFGFRKK